MGIGNTLLSDEGVGVHAIEHLRNDPDTEPALALVDGGTLSFSLLPLLLEADALIVIDAAQLNLAPGAVRRFTGPRMDRLVRGGIRTVHEVGLKELLDMARLEGRLPRRRAVIAVQPATLDWGMALTPPVAATLVPVSLMVHRIAQRWRALLPAPVA